MCTCIVRGVRLIKLEVYHVGNNFEEGRVDFYYKAKDEMCSSAEGGYSTIITLYSYISSSNKTNPPFYVKSGTATLFFRQVFLNLEKVTFFGLFLVILTLWSQKPTKIDQHFLTFNVFPRLKSTSEYALYAETPFWPKNVLLRGGG